MKFKLLLAPLLIGFIPSVNAIPFSNIVVKADLGEKYIVKKSAVYITKTFDENDFVSLVTKTISATIKLPHRIYKTFLMGGK